MMPIRSCVPPMNVSVNVQATTSLLITSSTPFCASQVENRPTMMVSVQNISSLHLTLFSFVFNVYMMPCLLILSCPLNSLKDPSFHWSKTTMETTVTLTIIEASRFLQLPQKSLSICSNRCYLHFSKRMHANLASKRRVQLSTPSTVSKKRSTTILRTAVECSAHFWMHQKPLTGLSTPDYF